MSKIIKYQSGSSGKTKLPILPTYANVQAAQDKTKVYQDPINPLEKDKANRDAEQKNAWRKPVNTNVPRSEQLVTNLKGLGNIAYHTLKMPAQAGALALSMQMAAPLATTSLAAPSLSTLLTHTGIGMAGAIGIDHMYNEMGGKPMGEAFDVKNPIGRFAANLITPGGLAGMFTATPKAKLNIYPSKQRINPHKPMGEASNVDELFKNRLNHLEELKKQKLIHPDTDLKYFAQSDELTGNLTKDAINQSNTYYRGVNPKNINAVDIAEMQKAGVNVNDEKAVGAYMASHIPHKELDYTSGFQTLNPNHSALYTSPGYSNYGTHTYKLFKPSDFSRGTYSDWLKDFNNYSSYDANLYKNIDEVPQWMRTHHSQNTIVSNFVGKKGQKIFDNPELVTGEIGRTKSLELPGLNTPKQLPVFGNVPPVVNTTPKSWSMQELPGLHLKSTMSNNPKGIHTNIRQSDGTIDTRTVLDQMKRIEGDARYAEWEKGFREVYGEGLENLPKRMDYNEFIKTGQKNLIELEHIRGSEINKRFLENRIYHSGYETDELFDYETVALGNKTKFGRGSSAHDLPEETLGHLQVMRTKESPDVLTTLGIQSDAFQGTHRIMPKGKLIKVPNTPNYMDEQGALFDKVTGENVTQKQLLDKNHQERFLQELVDYAGKRGDVNKVRVPTSETAATVQGYVKVKPVEYQKLLNKYEGYYEGHLDALLNRERDNLRKWQDNIDEIEYGLNPENAKIVSENDYWGGFRTESGVRKYRDDLNFYKTEKEKSIKRIDELPNEYYKEKEIAKKELDDYMSRGGLEEDYSPEHQTILKKYSELPKIIKKLFGEEPKIVTDGKGNTWYEFDIPKKFKEGKGEIKAFSLIPPAAIIGAGTYLQSQQKGGIIKYQKGKPVSKKVLVVAESPTYETTAFLPRYPHFDNIPEPHVISRKSNLPVPERMQTLWRHIVNTQQLAANTYVRHRSDIDRITWSLNQVYDKKTEKAQIQKELAAIRDPLFPIDDKKFKVVTESDRIAHMASDARHSRLMTTMNELQKKFDQNNPVIETQDDTFVKEANNVKTFYKRTDPSVHVEVLPLYKNKELLKKKLSELTPNDKFLLFGHSGDKLAGVSNDTIAKYLQNCSVEDIYLGTCKANRLINSYQNLKGKTINYRPDNSWLGINPNATNLDEAMWSRREYIDSNDNYWHIVGPLIPGVTHKQVKLRKGGIINAQKGKKLPAIPLYYNAQPTQDNIVRQYNPVTNPDERYVSEEEARKLRVAQREKELQKHYSQPGMISGMKRKPTPSEVKAHAESSVSYNDKLYNDPVGTLGPDIVMSVIPELMMLKGPQQAISRGLNKLNPFKSYNPWSKVDNVSTPKFISEIDWSKWNKEIPNNKSLMDEYLQIEKTAKQNGTWMRYSDGSTFNGTPEQFVQQNSSNFKKAFPNPILDKNNNIQINYHGSPNKFSEFKVNDIMGEIGNGIYTTSDRNYAKASSKLMDSWQSKPSDNATILELYQNSNNPQNYYKDYEKYVDIKIMDFDNKYRFTPKFTKKYKIAKKKLDDDLSSVHVKLYDEGKINKIQDGFDSFTKRHQTVVPFDNYPKSAIGNNGMFDMTNPNIYKALLPVGLGTTAYNKVGKNRKSGIIKYQKGAKTYYTDEEIAKMNNNQSQKRNIHTNKAVITPYQEWVKQNAYQSPIAKQIKESSQRQREQSEVYTEPNGKITVYSKGIQPTASPIDFAVGGIGALYGGGLKLAGTQLDLVNPIPMPNVSKLIRKIDDYLPTTVDKVVKPRYKINLTPDGLYEGQFLNQKEYLGEGLENLVYKSNDNKNAFKLRHVMQPTKDISNIKLRSRLLEELSGQRTPTVGYFKIEGVKPSMPIIQQPYIPHHGGPITEQEIQDFVTKHKMQKLNNWKHPSYKYKNYVLDDLHEENFVRDKEGNIRLIDLFAKKLKEHRPPIDHDEF